MDRKAYDYGFRAGNAAARPGSRLELFIKSPDYKLGYVHGHAARLGDPDEAAALRTRLAAEYGIPADRLDAPPPEAAARHEHDEDEDD
ncbi:MAG TPA: hypothetical protein VFW49_06250 [Fluviicoccus sp.]|nr:hypothetical protein [Fluviicoccus sp.]